MGAILEVRDLRVTYHPPKGGSHRALDGVSFHLEPGEVMGVLGESGSGKSTLATSLLGLFHANAVAVSGEVLLEGRNLLQAKLEELEKIRGKCISLIFQEPSVALHPTMRTGRQVRQVLAAHGVKGGSTLDQRTRGVLEMLFLAEEAERIARSYPHQLSGGQRQRILIAQAIACGPSVVIADEPTASLDAREKLATYRRAGIREYLLWRTADEAVDWWMLEEDEYRLLPVEGGIIRSQVFPGLWLDAAALVAEDGPRLMAALQKGLQSAEHVTFVAELRARSK